MESSDLRRVTDLVPREQSVESESSLESEDGGMQSDVAIAFQCFQYRLQQYKDLLVSVSNAR